MPLSIDRRRALATISSFVAAPFLAPCIGRAAEAWPIRQVKYVNGFPAGGATDTLSRVLCQKMSELSGQSFVVENKAGAGGVLGADAIAKSPADGYTIGLGGIASNVLAIGSYAKLPYRPREDFTFISGMWQLPNILTAKKDLFSADLKELLAAFKKEPGKYTYASAGFGTTLHLSGEMMNSMAGVQVRHVPYRGAAPALNDLLGGNVDMLFDNLPGSLPSVRSGAIRPVAVTAKKRHGGASRRARVRRTPARLRDDLMDRADWPRQHAGRPRRADQRAHRKSPEGPLGATALRRLGGHHLADHAAGDISLSRQRGRPAVADHESGRDQAGGRVRRAEVARVSQAICGNRLWSADQPGCRCARPSRFATSCIFQALRICVLRQCVGTSP